VSSHTGEVADAVRKIADPIEEVHLRARDAAQRDEILDARACLSLASSIRPDGDVRAYFGSVQGIQTITSWSPRASAGFRLLVNGG
jgi:hypothetical protein